DGGEAPLWGYIGVYEDILVGGVGFGNYSDRLGYEYTPEGKRGPAWGPDYSGSLGLAAFDRHSGERLWQVDARHSFLHNGIVAGGGRVYCLDKLPKRVEEQNSRRGLDDPATYRLVALDAKTGEEVWSLGGNVFGTWLGYSEKYDVLLHAGAAASDRSGDEVGSGMAAHRGADGSLLWEKEGFSYAGPCIIYNDLVITNTTSYRESRGAFKLLDGTPVEATHPVTGALVPWRFTRTHGCNTAVASEHLLTFRSGAAGYYDLASRGGTGNLGGFKSGCSSNLIVANGVLNAPDYTRTCTCGYQNQTSLALIHMPENEMWTYDVLGGAEHDDAPVRRMGINLGAPGDRLAESGTLWVDYPSVGGASPDVAVELAGDEELQWFRRHSSRVSGDGVPWVGASGVEGVHSITVPVVLGVEADLAEGIRLAHSSDDAEESESGKVGLTSSDLELTDDGGPQTIGIRFPSVPVPRGAKLTRAYVQFKVDETAGDTTNLEIRAQADDNAARFADKPFDISKRSRTSAAVRWEPKPWNANSDPGPDHQTPDLAPILREVFARPGWRTGNAVALIITGSGKRVADSFDGDKEGAPRLFVELEEAAAVPEPVEPEVTVPPRPYTIRLHFVEPDETVQAGQRAFDVLLQGTTVLLRFDVAAEAGGALRSVVKEFKGVSVAGEVSVVLKPLTDREPVLCGIELVEEAR
ncbi:MAG: malectin domain-containing carbohydrate-binding protein, partial [Armatimonadota bacterium]